MLKFNFCYDSEIYPINHMWQLVYEYSYHLLYVPFHDCVLTYLHDSSALAVGGLSERGEYYITMDCHSTLEKLQEPG